MAHQQQIFTQETGKIHDEHNELRQNLAELVRSLDHLRCDSGAPGNLIGAAEVAFLTQHFAGYLPSHFDREEEVLLDKVSEVSEELMELTATLKEEHRQLKALLTTFSEAVDGLEESMDVIADVTKVKLLGRVFTDQFGRHIATEDTELAGFL